MADPGNGTRLRRARDFDAYYRRSGSLMRGDLNRPESLGCQLLTVLEHGALQDVRDDAERLPIDLAAAAKETGR